MLHKIFVQSYKKPIRVWSQTPILGNGDICSTISFLAIIKVISSFHMKLCRPNCAYCTYDMIFFCNSIINGNYLINMYGM